MNNDFETFATPSVRANETPDGYEIAFEIPGAGKGDVDLHVDGRTLTMKTHAKHENPAGFRCAVSEFGRVNYAASLDLPDLVDPATIAGRVENGILTVTMSKRAELKPRKIEIG